MTNLRVSSGNQSDGFGIVEVVVSMFLLSLMAVAFLPVLVQSVQLARSNAAIATATQMLSADLDRARQSSPSCTPASFRPPADGKFQVKGEWAVTSDCLTVKYTSAISADGKALAQAVTLILVEP